MQNKRTQVGDSGVGVGFDRRGVVRRHGVVSMQRRRGVRSWRPTRGRGGRGQRVEVRRIPGRRPESPRGAGTLARSQRRPGCGSLRALG